MHQEALFRVLCPVAAIIRRIKHIMAHTTYLDIMIGSSKIFFVVVLFLLPSKVRISNQILSEKDFVILLLQYYVLDQT